MRKPLVGVLTAVGLAVSLGSVPIVGQSGPSGQAAGATLRTSWGDPDISGFFTNKDQQGIPFERSEEFGDRQYLSEEEFAEREARADRQLLTDNAEFDIETAETANAGAVGSATSPPPHWLDRGKPTRRTSLVIDPPNGRIPPMTPDGPAQMQRRVAARVGGRFGNGPAASYTDGSLYDRCITRGLPGSMMPAIYGNSYQIVQGPGFVGIRYEMIHETRIIPLTGSAHVSSVIRQHMGDARGHWEGDTLVVETTNFRPESVYRNANPDALRLVERFRRTGPDTVSWSVTVDDATTWTRPWTFEMALTRDDSQPVFEYACHEGNYAMENILSGSRAAEKAAAEGK
jgi:hypothetical protein